jgi:BirA family transcriptional regulator, biotin operon repressor / biotin---[acetyl-CoA-carboxylase] ligase
MRDGLPPGLRAALEALNARRPDLWLDVRWSRSLLSTMDAAASAAESGLPAGHIVLADEQTAGRGRRGRTWNSPPGAGLYFSYVTRPTRHIELLTIAAGVGVVEGVARATGVRAHLKWPNDLLVGHRKLAGVLAEGAHLGTPRAAVIVGVGLNLEPAAYPPDVAARATDLESAGGAGVSRFEIFAAVLEHLSGAFATLEAGRAGDILQKWRAASPTADGTPVRWLANNVWHYGVTAGIDEAGALRVATDSGEERVIAGELQWDPDPRSLIPDP